MSSETKRFMAMKGDGYYSKATTGAKEAIDSIADRVLAAVERMAPADGPAPFRASDMGAADGGTSLDLWRRVLGEVRRRAPGRPLEMVYTDLPRNDFSQLFRLLHGQTDRPSYLAGIANLYVYASATSFHEPIMPPGTLDLGFSATASHYVSRVPVSLTDHVHMVGAQGSEREAFLAQGREDWQRMLLGRERELKPGGRLVLLNFGIDEQGRYLGNTGGVSMFATFEELWRGLAEEGAITREEYVGTNFPQVYRTAAEMVAPLEDESHPVRRAGLRLEHVESRSTRCPYAAAFASHGDAGRFAREYIPTLRSWSEPTFAKGLSPDRPAEERAAIIDELFGRYERRVAQMPHGHGMDYVHILLVCTKE